MESVMKNRFYLLLVLLGLLNYSCENVIEENKELDASLTTGVLVTKTNPIDNITMDVVKQVASMYGNMQGTQTKSGEEKAIEEVSPVKNEKGDVLMYVVNYAGNAGYVILSGRNEYRPILAYSETGKFDMVTSQVGGASVWLKEQLYAVENVEALPDSVRRQNARAWNAFFDEQKKGNLGQQGIQTRSVDPDLQYQAGAFIEESLQKWSDEGYTIYPYGDGSILAEFFDLDEIESIKEYLAINAEDRFFDGFASTVYIRTLETSEDEEVKPLLKSTWGQTGGYGIYVPNGTAGCVAVAVGQIMRFHEYPLLYNWNAMAYGYPTDMTARLFAEIGEKVNTDYSKPNESAASTNAACSALKEYGYKNSRIKNHSAPYVVGQLKERRPVWMRGADAGNGHAWVCDGYKHKRTTTYCEVMALDKAYWDYEKKFYYRAMYSGSFSSTYTYYHMNWGWSGNQDGYYYEDNVKSSIGDFSTSRQDIVDIYPVE